jgi:hypothetical protein
VALDHILRHTEMLREGLANPLNVKGTKYISLVHKLFLKQKNLARMEYDIDYVPVSARVASKLQAWAEAEDLPEFTALVTNTSTLVTQFQLQLKANIIANIHFELQVLK